MAGSATNKTDKKFDTLTKAPANNNSKSSNSLDLVDSDSREVPLNGFNRFDPKYISIGPKALRESTFASTNLNKCATLRHGGRYGGSLSSSFDRGTNPVLKKAAPPSVATVSKEFNITETTKTVVPKLVSTSTNTTSFGNTAFNNNRSNSSLAGPSTPGFASGYETDTGSNMPYKRTASKQLSNDSSSTFRREQTPIDNNRPTPEPQQSSVYSIDAVTYRPPAKTPQHTQKPQAYHHHPSPVQEIQPAKNLQEIQPALPVKQSQMKAASKVSIVNQPLPEIPPAVRMSEASQIRNIQPLSAANLDNYRSLQRSVMNNAVMSNLISAAKQQQHHSSSYNVQPQSRSTIQPKHVTVLSNPNKATVPLPPKITPPTLPPKNRNRDQQSDGTATLSRQNNNYSKQSQHIQSGTSTLPPPQKQSSSGSSSRGQNQSQIMKQQQSQNASAMATYSTFGYDAYQAEREARRYQVDRDNNRHASMQQHQPHQHHSTAYNEQFKMASSSSRQQGYPTMPHKSKEASFTTSGNGNGGRDKDRDQRSYHHHSTNTSGRQYNQNPNSAMSGPSRRNIDDSHSSYRQTSLSNRHGHGMNMSHGHDPSEFAGKSINRYPQSILLQKTIMDMPMYNNDMYSVTEL